MTAPELRGEGILSESWSEPAGYLGVQMSPDTPYPLLPSYFLLDQFPL